MTVPAAEVRLKPLCLHFLSQEPAEKVLESPLPDAAAISAEARKAGVRTPKLPELPPTEGEEPARKETTKSAKPPPAEDDFEALAARFAALKKR